MSIFNFPLRQHVGKEAEACVAIDDIVKRGQPLAFAKTDELSVPVHCSVNGIVREITASGIKIEENATDFHDYLPIREAPFLTMIRDAGIVGLGGAGFPTYAKLSKPIPGGTVIINAAECEPILCHNMGRIKKSAPEILEGLRIIMEQVQARQGIIAIKKQHSQEIALLQKAIGGQPVTLSLLPDLYPMGEERAILREVLGTLLVPTELPLAANAIVINLETVFRVYEAVRLKKPLIDKDLTIAGKITGNHQSSLIQVFLDQPLGISTDILLQKAGGISDSYGELIAGGPFTGKRTTADQPLVKTTGAILVSECFPKGPEKIGLLVCACGADEARLRELAASLHSKVVDVEFCKQATPLRGTRKCENPGHCPGQVQKILNLKKSGAAGVLISNCNDCSNTVMSCAPKLGLKVYHCTDQALRSVNLLLIRKMK